MLNKFKNKVKETYEQAPDEVVEEKEKNVDEDEDNVSGTSWMRCKLFCEETPVLAKDASSKGDDWFEIYDPRNPINKRRRGEAAGPSKDGKGKR